MLSFNKFGASFGCVCPIFCVNPQIIYYFTFFFSFLFLSSNCCTFDSIILLGRNFTIELQFDEKACVGPIVEKNLKKKLVYCYVVNGISHNVPT